MRPIDADALIEKCGDWYVEEGTESGFIGTLKNLLATEPTIQPQSTTGQLNDGARSTDLIDRQQAIDGKIVIQRTNGVEIYSDEAVPVEYLKNLPSRQPEPSTNCSEFPNNSDTISRQAVIDALDCINGVEEVLRSLPSIQPEPHEGTWVYGEDSTADCVDGYRCSQCGFFAPWDYNHKLIDYINDYAYCPHCGVRMKGATP